MAKKAAAPKDPVPQPEADPPVPPPAAMAADPSVGNVSEKVRSRLAAFIRSLPDEVEAARELSWIRNHPALLRRSARKNNIDPIQITINDLKRPPHGPAPSKLAVQLLRYHAQNPIEFFKRDLDSQHKRAAIESGAIDEEDENKLVFLDDLTEVDKLIRDATDRTRNKPKSANG